MKYRLMIFNDAQCKLEFYETDSMEKAADAYYNSIQAIRAADSEYRGDDEEIYCAFMSYQCDLIDEVKAYGIKEVETA